MVNISFPGCCLAGVFMGFIIWNSFVFIYIKNVEPDLPLAPRVEALELPNQFWRATPTAPLVMVQPSTRAMSVAAWPWDGYTHTQRTFVVAYAN